MPSSQMRGVIAILSAGYALALFFAHKIAFPITHIPVTLFAETVALNMMSNAMMQILFLPMDAIVVVAILALPCVEIKLLRLRSNVMMGTLFPPMGATVTVILVSVFVRQIQTVFASPQVPRPTKGAHLFFIGFLSSSSKFSVSSYAILLPVRRRRQPKVALLRPTALPSIVNREVVFVL